MKYTKNQPLRLILDSKLCSGDELLSPGNQGTIASAGLNFRVPGTKIKYWELAATYSPPLARGTIGSTGLNFRVRKGIGCDPCDKPPTLNI